MGFVLEPLGKDATNLVVCAKMHMSPTMERMVYGKYFLPSRAWNNGGSAVKNYKTICRARCPKPARCSYIFS